MILCFLASFPEARAGQFVVNSTSDANTGAGNTGTLRYCITQANLTGAKDTITFAIPGSGPFTLTVVSNYPTISQPLYINGTSQSGTVQGQLGTGTRVMQIILNGPGSNTVYGFQITANNCEISGLVIQDFYKGIYINGGDNCWIWGCYIGTAADGLSATAATECYDDGIALNNNANNNTIGTNGNGSNDANEGNLIAANGDGGIQYAGECIILNEAGSLAADCTGNWIAGNFLGVNETGNAALYFNATANTQRGTGIQITNSTNATIGTNADGISDTYERNVISGNSDEGIVLTGASNCKIKGNYIGTDKTGLIGIPNYINGGTLITTGQVVLKNTSTNNVIGTDGDGVNDAIEGNVIGSSTIVAGSASSYSDAVDITSSSTGNRVSGNRVGIGADGVTALNILTTGITVNDYAINIEFSNNNIVGTNGDGVSDALEANYVGNSGSAIAIVSSNSCTVAGNFCGLGTNGSTAAPLGYAGIYVLNSTGTRVGSSGSNSLERNYTINSSKYGIWVDGAASANNDLINIRYNVVGLRPDGIAAPNAQMGIYIFDLSNADTIQYNIIAQNGTGAATGTYPGVQIGGSNASEQSSGNVIKLNTIYKNIGPGINIVNSSSLTNKISQNSIYNNGNGSDNTGKLKLGIDLAANGVTANDALDPDAGPNGLANFPVITGIAPGAPCQATVAGTYNGLATTQYYIEVFSSDVCNGDTSGVDYNSSVGNNYGEGKTYLGASSVVTTDASGNANWTLNIALSSVSGKYLTAVAIQNNGAAINSTSEFSMCFAASSDLGDAPDSYSTLLASCGPTHVNINSNLRIGATVDAEADGVPSANADGDGADEDGLSSFPTLHVKTTSYTISSIPVTNSTGSAATLYAWIDFNLNGVFEASEFTSVAVPSTGSQNVNLTWNLASFTCGSTIKDGDTYMRMRLTTTALSDNAGTTNIDERCQGVAANGEVEDYKLTILPVDYGDLPNTFPVATAVVYADATAGKVWLGAVKPDSECTQNYSSDALGDGPTEEDGLTTVTGFGAGNYNWVIKLNSNQADKTVYYGMWIDWEGNNNFNGAADAFYSGSAVCNGINNVSVSVYIPGVVNYMTGIRVVASDVPVTSGMYNSTFVNSEVEDYILYIVLGNEAFYLTGTKTNNGNLLKWTNNTSPQVSSYAVERSIDNSHWETIATISPATLNNTNTTYSYQDNTPSPVDNYYRLTVTYDSHNKEYSNTINIKNTGASTDCTVYPNPVKDELHISHAVNFSSMAVTNLAGEILIQRSKVSSTVDVRALAPGIYFIKMYVSDGSCSILKFVKL